MKIALVFPSGHLTSTPCIPSLAILLAEKGIEVDVYAAENVTTITTDSYSIFENIPNLKLYIYPIKSRYFRENISFLLLGFLPWWLNKIRGKRYDFIIAAGVRALFLTGIYGIFARKSYIFLSLELYIRNEMPSWKGKIFKCLESFFNRRAIFSIIQDKSRAAILKRENGIDLRDILIFPNSSVSSNGSVKSTGSLVEHYGISGKRVALYAGSIFAKWAMTPELIRDALTWPEDWVLMLHSRARLQDLTQRIPELKDLDSKKILLSNNPLSERHYEEMVRAVDVGIALYEGCVSENMYYTGYSSGKIAQYLKCGVPIILNNLPLLGDLVNNYHCGLCINSLEEIAPALHKISLRYDYYTKGARKAFAAVFAPERYMQPLLDRLSFN
jgi:hypothetical protein